VLFSSTGVTAAVERTQQAATLLAIEEVNASGGVLGRPIEPVCYDRATASWPSSCATRLAWR
jgi:branched-chain amino acid transport system substrate-binding protein